MTTMGRGLRGEGWAPLLVIETETGQVATYMVKPQSLPNTNRPAFLLVDRRTDRRLARSIAETTAAR